MKSILLLLVTVFIYQVGASEIVHLRHDLTIPDECNYNEVSDFFASDLKYFTYSRTGNKGSKFDFSYDISREEIRQLWSIFRSGDQDSGRAMSWKNSSERKKKIFMAIYNHFEKMDFDFNDEGQVLEILTLVKIKKSLKDDMYITGSVAYSGNRTSNRIGELDIVVGYKKDCTIAYVGEVKVNPRRVGHAKSQLARFKRFIENEKTFDYSFIQ